MPIVIKEIRVRTQVERRIVAEADIPDEVVRQIEQRVWERLAAHGDGSGRDTARSLRQRRKNER